MYYHLLIKIKHKKSFNYDKQIWLRKTAKITVTVEKWPLQNELEDTKGVIRIHKSKDRQHNGKKDKQRSTKLYTEN